jgi:hypothetical protein
MGVYGSIWECMGVYGSVRECSGVVWHRHSTYYDRHASDGIDDIDTRQ